MEDLSCIKCGHAIGMAVDVDKLNFVCSKGMDMHEGADVAGYKSFVLKVKLQCDDIKLLKHVRFLHSIGSRVLGHWILNMIASLHRRPPKLA